MKKVSILWTDDEIDLLKPHIIFLDAKGYKVSTASNGDDAIKLVKENAFDLVFLDENMPGKSGLETLSVIKTLKPSLPVVMITKSEEEDIMDAAIGSKIADYLIKPVNPNQILLTIKKNIDNKKLITRETTSAYQSEFSKISVDINRATGFHEWVAVYHKLLHWELELEHSEDQSMGEVLRMQKTEANTEFGKFIRNNYFNWFENENSDRPLMSPGVLKKSVIPELEKGNKTVFILVDNLRYDQWKVIQPEISDFYSVHSEEAFCSILPTATQYARNSIFSGMMPSDIAERYPDLWLNDDDEGGKNQYEEELLSSYLKRLGVNVKHSYAKISSNKAGIKLVDNIKDVLQNDFVTIIYNFVDMLSHANTDMEMIRELASTDSAYRSLTLSWFKHSHLYELLRTLSHQNITVVLTTDHGTIRVNKPIKVVGDRSTSKNLRYKTGKNLSYNPKEVFEVRNPSKVYLPKTNISSKYIFAYGDSFLAYPNNYNYFVNYYTNTYQHGGISLEEMVLPLVTLKPKQV
ncbi:MAG: bifunctional response regulator/alkaline phosphatase family protein [Bacteroidales bacterium]|nr:bifunctional response regulator/alkaline phosphatase family protein [Bacteroidales bacterium]MBN2817982.1 bifunctional response regulator/alkaline phosphatase family protein [Bacteroidales bacterium]